MCCSQQPFHNDCVWSIVRPLSKNHTSSSFALQMKPLLNWTSSESLGFIRLAPKWWNLNSAWTSQSHRTHKALLSLLCHISQVGLFTYLILYRYTLHWQYSSKYLSQLLFSSSSSLDLLAEDSRTKPCTWFCPGIDLQYFWWFLSIQCLRAHLAALSKIPHASSSPINGCLSQDFVTTWLQFPYVLAPTSVISCYDQPVWSWCSKYQLLCL
jgi:hypothetical protein